MPSTIDADDFKKALEEQFYAKSKSDKKIILKAKERKGASSHDFRFTKTVLEVLNVVDPVKNPCHPVVEIAFKNKNNEVAQ